MFKSVLIILAVYGAAIYASPSVNNERSASIGCSCDTMTRATPTAHCATDKFVADAVNAAVVQLEQKLSNTNESISKTVCQTVTAANDTDRTAVKDAVRTSVNEAVSTAIKDAVRTSVNEAVSTAVKDAVRTSVNEAVSAAVKDALASLEQKLQQQSQAIASIGNTVSQTDVAVAPLKITIQQLGQSLLCNRTSGYEYYPTVNSCYKLHESGSTWPNANSTCHSEGGHLAVINSDEEARVLTQATGWWCSIIGVYQDPDNVWRTVTGATLTEGGYSKWANGYPKDGAVKSNVMYGSLLNDGTYINTGCDFNFFVCEKSP